MQLQRVCLDAGKFRIFAFRLFFLLRKHAVKSGHGALQARAETLIHVLRCSQTRPELCVFTLEHRGTAHFVAPSCLLLLEKSKQTPENLLFIIIIIIIKRIPLLERTTFVF